MQHGDKKPTTAGRYCPVNRIWTDFSTPACSKGPESARLYLLAALLALAGCSDPDAESRFEMTRVESTWTNGRLNVISEQKLTLSDEAREALIHGVPLTLELDLVLRNTSNQTRIGQEKSSYEIRYLPLSDYYQLTFQGNRGGKDLSPPEACPGRAHPG